ncbi:MAG: glycoside hydrolase family protein [Solirubrobacteraceae bacterium]
MERFDDAPILRPGPLGAFDDSGVTMSCLVSTAERDYLYFTGWTRGVTVPFYFYVGLATREADAEDFVRVSEAPILERDPIDPYLTASPWVIREGTKWRMWYVSGLGWTQVDGQPQHRYHIRYAESADGVAWCREGHVAVDLQDDSEYAISRPCVVHDGDLYRMWFSARGERYLLGYAESRDGLTWSRDDSRAALAPSGSGWDSEMTAYPCVFEQGEDTYLLYNGNGYGRSGLGYATRKSER